MCAKRSPLRARRCAARCQRGSQVLCVRRTTRSHASQVLRAQVEDVCALTQSCRASIVPRTATTIDEAAREAAGKAALQKITYISFKNLKYLEETRIWRAQAVPHKKSRLLRFIYDKVDSVTVRAVSRLPCTGYLVQKASCCAAVGRYLDAARASRLER